VGRSRRGGPGAPKVDLLAAFALWLERNPVVQGWLPSDAAEWTVPDNSGAVRRVRRHDGATKRGRAVDALSAMERSGEAVTLPALARRAGVSVSLLHASHHVDLTEAVGRSAGVDGNLGGDELVTLNPGTPPAGGPRSWSR
jgi:hypothetical protein